MKLQFDPNQQFQLDAVSAITDLFDGQPAVAPKYSAINVGDFGGLFTRLARTDLGVDNHLLLAEENLHASTRKIRAQNDIEIGDEATALDAWELFEPPANTARHCHHSRLPHDLAEMRESACPCGCGREDGSSLHRLASNL